MFHALRIFRAFAMRAYAHCCCAAHSAHAPLLSSISAGILCGIGVSRQQTWRGNAVGICVAHAMDIAARSAGFYGAWRRTVGDAACCALFAHIAAIGRWLRIW